jgi:hypothetical protein
MLLLLLLLPDAGGCRLTCATTSLASQSMMWILLLFQLAPSYVIWAFMNATFTSYAAAAAL